MGGNPGRVVKGKYGASAPDTNYREGGSRTHTEGALGEGGDLQEQLSVR